MSQQPLGRAEPGRPSQSRAGRLDRDSIVIAALEMIDEQGPSSVSMRRLGARLGVEGMALYRYLPSRDDLLDAVVERVVDELYADPGVHLLPRDDWSDYLGRLARGVRRVALAHPQAFPLVATRPPVAPWMRPPLRSLRWIDAFFAALRSQGFTPGGAVYAYRAFTSFLLGHLLLEVAAMGVQTGPVDDVRDDGSAPLAADEGPELADFPHVQEAAEALAEDHAEEEFEASLASLLERVDRAAGPRRR